MIGVIDYGMGNIHSVLKALEHLGAKAIIADNGDKVKGCDKLVFPGVGAFEDAVLELKERRLIDPILKGIGEKKIFLGICLGMQLLFEKSQEASKASGLGVLKGDVRKFPSRKGLKVPHMGWNQLKIVQSACPLLKGVAEGSYVYFCHSYYPQLKEPGLIAAGCDYGIEFACVVSSGNVFGVQFHPEKSQETGLQILKNFVEM